LSRTRTAPLTIYLALEDNLEKNDRPPSMDLSPPDSGGRGEQQGLLLALGLTCFLLGGAGIAIESMIMPESLLHAGLLLLMGGSAQLLHAFPVKTPSDETTHLATALFYLLAGLTIISSPLADSTAAIFFFSIALLGVGVSRLLLARRCRGGLNSHWITVAGAATCLLALLVATGWPGPRFRLIALITPVELIFNGWTCFILARLPQNGLKGR
jgi:uncharacterized membrane protein HdeD (DUF308 family)